MSTMAHLATKNMGFTIEGDWEEIPKPKNAIVVGVAGQEKHGKCVPAGTLVAMADGSLRPIELIQAGENVWSADVDFGQVVRSRVLAVEPNGFRRVLCLLLDDGRTVMLTPNHRVFTNDSEGWIEAQYLTPGDLVLTPYALPDTHKKIPATPQEIRVAIFLGFMIADGYLGATGGPLFTKVDNEVMKMFTDTANALGFETPVRGDRPAVGVSGCRELLRDLGLFNKTAGDKFVPAYLLTAPRDVRAAFLSALFTCDGWLCKNVPDRAPVQIGYCSKSERLVREVAHMLLSFQVAGRVRSRVVNGATYWMWEGATRAATQFIAEIGLLGEKGRRGAELCAAANEGRVKRYGRLGTDESNGPTATANGLMWSKVTEIEMLATELPVYDLEVEGTHCFIANGIVVHNSHFALSAPGPVMIFNIDIGLDGVAYKFQADKVVRQCMITIPTQLGKKSAEVVKQQAAKSIAKFYTNYELALKNPKVRTIIIDNSTSLWELLLLSHFGKTIQIPQHLRTVPNLEMAELVRRPLGDPSCDKNVVHILQMRKEYKNDNWTGKYEWAGYNKMGYLVQAMLLAERDKVNDFWLKVLDSRHRPELNGVAWRVGSPREDNALDCGPFAPFAFVAAEIFEDTVPQDWE